MAVEAASGGVVSSATGETVMIGAGVLKQDTQVAISRIDINHLEAITGLAPPSSAVFASVAAFKLDLGGQTTNSRVQLAIPVQPGSNAHAGDEVYFFRKGQVPQPDGSLADTWWLVENGFVGEDGITNFHRAGQPNAS